MSGTDPSMGGGSRGGPSAAECPGSPFETTLASPNPAVVPTLSVRQVLAVVKIDTPVRAVVAVDDGGNIAGAITREPARLRACMELGSTYTAEILAIHGGAVTVIVSGA